MDQLIRARAHHLPPGGQARGTCPFCNAQHERSFRVQRDLEMPHRIWFQCYRGTCGERGWVEDREGARMVLLQADLCYDDEPYHRAMPEHNPLPGNFFDIIHARYNLSMLTCDEQGLRYERKGESLCMPWLDVHQHQKGWVEKRFIGPHKSHHELVDKGSAGRLAYPRVGHSYKGMSPGDICVLVEDLISAYRINQEVGGRCIYAVALLGAQISYADAMEIASHFDRVVICLDPDQWPLGAMRVLKSFKTLGCQMRATTLETDPKDAETEDLWAFTQSLPEMFT